jgi:hypothetical protein
MQNFIGFVNEQRCWEDSPHCHDCHDPPHEARGGFVEDISPPRRLAGVARSDPWKVTRAQLGFPGGGNLEAKIILGCRARPLEHGDGQGLPAEGSAWRRLPSRAGNSIPGCVVRGED